MIFWTTHGVKNIAKNESYLDEQEEQKKKKEEEAEKEAK